MQTAPNPLASKISPNDVVVFCGRIVGRAVEMKADGWIIVRDPSGRVDEYPAMACVRG